MISRASARARWGLAAAVRRRRRRGRGGLQQRARQPGGRNGAVDAIAVTFAAPPATLGERRPPRRATLGGDPRPASSRGPTSSPRRGGPPRSRLDVPAGWFQWHPGRRLRRRARRQRSRRAGRLRLGPHVRRHRPRVAEPLRPGAGNPGSRRHRHGRRARRRHPQLARLRGDGTDPDRGRRLRGPADRAHGRHAGGRVSEARPVDHAAGPRPRRVSDDHQRLRTSTRPSSGSSMSTARCSSSGRPTSRRRRRSRRDQGVALDPTRHVADQVELQPDPRLGPDHGGPVAAMTAHPGAPPARRPPDHSALRRPPPRTKETRTCAIDSCSR